MTANARARFDNAKRRRPENHDRQRQLTPAYILEPCRVLLGGIGLDPCTEPENPTKAGRFWTPPVDGCSLPWRGESAVWCNPPYGEARSRWVHKCVYEAGCGIAILLLIPAHTETAPFQHALNACTSVLFVRARLRFELVRSNGRHEAASHGSALFGFNVDVSPLAAQGLGVVLRP